MIPRGLFDELHLGEIDPGRYKLDAGHYKVVDRKNGQNVGIIMVQRPDLVVVLFSNFPTLQGQKGELDLEYEDPPAGQAAFTVNDAVALAPNGDYRVVRYSARIVATRP
ncbi:hypothetical protein [Sorangium sp. So ce1099]|uniref:hypothetical protein n=1 Tax=Sorangium sp. So ce1099 TaxID=3133331 RepID=UPI003F611072